MATTYEERLREQALEEKREIRRTIMWAVIGVVLFIGFIVSLALIVPQYRVWAEGKKGEAEFMRAEQNRRIKVEEAKANLEAEKLNAQAEVERAKGAAEAIKIENGSITPTYIQYLWVRQQNASSNNRLIYIPTEAGLPILEAGKANEK